MTKRDVQIGGGDLRPHADALAPSIQFQHDQLVAGRQHRQVMPSPEPPVQRQAVTADGMAMGDGRENRFALLDQLGRGATGRLETGLPNLAIRVCIGAAEVN